MNARCEPIAESTVTVAAENILCVADRLAQKILYISSKLRDNGVCTVDNPRPEYSDVQSRLDAALQTLLAAEDYAETIINIIL